MGTVLALVLLVALVPFQTCRDWGFVDQNTGARKGYRQWFFGLRTGHWYHATALESFMRGKYPTELRQKWVSYQGTGRNILGEPSLFGHGRPGPIINLSPRVIDKYCEQASDLEKKQLYDALASGLPQTVQKAVDQVMVTVLDWKEQRPQTNGQPGGRQPVRPNPRQTSQGAAPGP